MAPGQIRQFVRSMRGNCEILPPGLFHKMTDSSQNKLNIYQKKIFIKVEAVEAIAQQQRHR